MGEIASKRDVANNHADNIANAASALDFPWLNGVDDDNTLAESGAYNSYHSLKSTFATLKQALETDAENLRAAAAAIEETDKQQAISYLSDMGNQILSCAKEKQ